MRTELNRTPAVKNKNVYVFTWDCTKGGGRSVWAWATWENGCSPKYSRIIALERHIRNISRSSKAKTSSVVNNGVFVYPEA